MNLENSHVLLTGATGGIGAALAEQLARTGARLTLVGRQGAALAALLSRYPKARFLACDLSDAAARANLVADLGHEPLDVLINAAGINDFNLFEEQSPERLSHVLDLNLKVPVLLTQALLPCLRQSKAGLILNVGSVLGAIGLPGYVVYCASKSGLRGFSEALRRELADSSIRVLYVAPRTTRTAINDERAVALGAELGNQTDTPEDVALQIMNAIRQERCVTHIGWPEKLLVRLNALLPGIVDRAMGKQLPIVKAHAHSSKD